MPLPIELIVNSAAPTQGEQVLQCHYVQVNSDLIRKETLNGREHIVLPSYTLPDNVVMNGGLYTREEIEANYRQLENTLAPLGHPVVDGKHVSATTPEALHANHVGAFNRNVQRRGNRIYLEKWIDVEFATNSEKGRQLLAAIEKREPIHTSVAVYTARELTPNAEGYQWIARISKCDHDAILLGEPGAATPEQGVGLMVNVAEAVSLKTNAGLLSDNSNGAQRERMSAAVTEHFGGESWLRDFDESIAVVHMRDGEAKAVAYSLIDGKVVFAGAEQSVRREESWVMNQVNRICASLGLQVHSETTTPVLKKPSPEADPMDKEEIAAMLKEQAETLAANMAEALKPLGERLTGLEANLQANAAQAEAPKREAVAKMLGELAANALTGEALNEAYAKLQSAAPLAAGFQANADQVAKGAPSADDYFGKGA